MKKESLVNLDALKELEMGPNWENDNKIKEEQKNGTKKQRIKIFIQAVSIVLVSSPFLSSCGFMFFS